LYFLNRRLPTFGTEILLTVLLEQKACLLLEQKACPLYFWNRRPTYFWNRKPAYFWNRRYGTDRLPQSCTAAEADVGQKPELEFLNILWGLGTE
jgi:hypothetical protein